MRDNFATYHGKQFMIAHVMPPAGPLKGTVHAPSSKNFTTRYILASCLAEGRSIVKRPAVQDDAVALVKCCRQMGAIITALDHQGEEIPFEVENDGKVSRLEVHGFGSSPKLLKASDPLNPGNAGAVFRLLLAISALLPEVEWTTNYTESLGKRPNIDLVEGLRQLGVEVEARGEDGCLPMKLKGGLDRIKKAIKAKREQEGIKPEDPFPITVSGAVSSQYTSALLFLVPLIDQDVEIHVSGRLKSVPLINTTRNVLSEAGIEVESSTERHYHRIRAGQKYTAREWYTNGDWPGSAAILGAAAAVPGSDITVEGLYDDLQGEKECIYFYRNLGCEVEFPLSQSQPNVLRIASPKDSNLQAASINGDLTTDAVLAMMGAAFSAEGTSRFVQIENLQYKECDRVREPLAELRKVWATAIDGGEGIKSAEKALTFAPDDQPDIIYVTGNPAGYEGGIEVDGRGDHRVIMMLSLAALRCRKGLRITGAEHVNKSFPGWFSILQQLGVEASFSE